jgi:hypothetical protein
MWHFECSIIEMNIKRKRKNTSKLNTNFWSQLYSPMCAHKKWLQALPLPIASPTLFLETASIEATWDTGPRQAQTLDLPPSYAFLRPVGTLESGVPPVSKHLVLSVPYCPRNPISAIIGMRRPGTLSPSNKHCGVQGSQGNGDSGRPTDNLYG